jgi:hypothetical protein
MQKHINTFLDQVVGREITCKTIDVGGYPYNQLISNNGFIICEFSEFLPNKTSSPSIALYRHKEIDRLVSEFFGITIAESHEHVVNWFDGIHGARKPEDFRKFIPHA